MSPKHLACLFLLKVLCSFRKYGQSSVLEECFKCKFYEKFLRISEKEEEDFWKYCDKVRKGELL